MKGRPLGNKQTNVRVSLLVQDETIWNRLREYVLARSGRTLSAHVEEAIKQYLENVRPANG